MVNYYIINRYIITNLNINYFNSLTMTRIVVNLDRKPS